MKIRTDFVTNSSSSSFILAFNNKEELLSYDNFKDTCVWFEYDEFLKLVENLKKNEENTNKEEALKSLHWSYYCEYKHRVIDEKVNRKDYKSWNDYNEAYNKLEQSEEFQNELELYLENDEEYQCKKKQLEDADLVVKGMIWDTSGGLLEWAIRNGFIENNFRNNCVLVWNVG